MFTGRTDVEAETPIFWPPDVKSWLIGKDSDPGRDWGQEEKGMTENEMTGWHHQLNGHEFGWTPGVGVEPLNCTDWSFQRCDHNEQPWKIDILSPNRASSRFFFFVIETNKDNFSLGGRFRQANSLEWLVYVSTCLGHRVLSIWSQLFGHVYEGVCGWD